MPDDAFIFSSVMITRMNAAKFPINYNREI